MHHGPDIDTPHLRLQRTGRPPPRDLLSTTTSLARSSRTPHAAQSTHSEHQKHVLALRRSTAGWHPSPVSRYVDLLAPAVHLHLLLANLDGGGPRGLSQLFMLEELMNRIKFDKELEALPLPCEYFDLMGGTGTGG